jgi:MoxR-like ATPase
MSFNKNYSTDTIYTFDQIYKLAELNGGVIAVHAVFADLNKTFDQVVLLRAVKTLPGPANHFTSYTVDLRNHYKKNSSRLESSYIAKACGSDIANFLNSLNDLELMEKWRDFQFKILYPELYQNLLEEIDAASTEEILEEQNVVEEETTQIEQDDIIGQDENKKVLEVAIKNNCPALLIGETGSGKTSIVRMLAKQHGKEFLRVNLNGQTTVDEFVGKWLIKGNETVWQDGILIQAMKKGSWLLVDEINSALADILFALHSLLDDDKMVRLSEKDGEIVKPHEEFRFFAAMNPVEEYAGTKELNKAFLSRFSVVLRFNYPTGRVETKIVEQKTGVDSKQALQIVSCGQKLRELKKNEEIYYTCSTRDLLAWGHLVKDLGIQEAFVVSILNKMPNEERDIAAKALTAHLAELKDLLSSKQTKTIVEEVKELSKHRQNLIKQNKELEEKMQNNKQALYQEIISEFTGVVQKVSSKIEQGSTQTITDKKVVITGTFTESRDFVENLLTKAGAIVQSSINNQTDFLLSGDKPGVNKLTKAKTLGLPIFSASQIGLNHLEIKPF